MNAKYLELAKEKITNVPLLINAVSKRVRQLNAGQRPLVKPDSPDMDHLDLALKEIGEGKLAVEPGPITHPEFAAYNSTTLN